MPIAKGYSGASHRPYVSGCFHSLPSEQNVSLPASVAVTAVRLPFRLASFFDMLKFVPIAGFLLDVGGRTKY